MPPKSTKKKPKARAALPELPQDAWTHIFEYNVRDRFGNVVIPGLAQLARASRASKLLLAAARAVKTPYDAEITFDGDDAAVGMPVSFIGGVAFGEFRFCFALVFIRHPANGRTFAVSVEEHAGYRKHGQFYRGGCYGWHDNTGCVQRVKRYHSLATLAERLNGHGSVWTARLNDLSYMMCREDLWRSPNGRTIIQGFKDFADRSNGVHPMPYSGLMPPRSQWLKTHNLEMLTHTTEEHFDDFLAYAVETQVVMGQHPNVPNHPHAIREYKRVHRLILFEESGAKGGVGYSHLTGKCILHDECWYGKSMSSSKSANPGALFKRPPPMHPPFIVSEMPFASELSIALGIFADPDLAEGCHWLVSLFKHYSGMYLLMDVEQKHGSAEREQRQLRMAINEPYPYWHKLETPQWKLQLMGQFALAADAHFRAQAAAPRVQRGAAAKAVRGVRRCNKNDEDADPEYERAQARERKRRRMRKAELDSEDPYDGLLEAAHRV